MQDGGGLCSPGRWKPLYRRPRNEQAQQIRGLLVDTVKDIPRSEIEKWIFSLATQSCEECPFKMVAEQCRSRFIEYVESEGFYRNGDWKDEWCIDVKLQDWLLHRLGDPD